MVKSFSLHRVLVQRERESAPVRERQHMSASGDLLQTWFPRDVSITMVCHGTYSKVCTCIILGENLNPPDGLHRGP